MSTYYYFRCAKCERTGGFLSHQAWGWGNFDIIDSFKFLAKHISECGEESIGLISEQRGDLYNKQARDMFLKETEDFFPCSDDWGFMKNDYKDYGKKWIAKELEKVKK